MPIDCGGTIDIRSAFEFEQLSTWLKAPHKRESAADTAESTHIETQSD